MRGWAPRVALVCAAGAIVLVTLIVPQLNAYDPRDTDVLSRFLGGTADYASERAYEQADTYFHAGMMAHCPNEDREHHEHGENHAHHEHHEHNADTTRASVDLPLGGAIRGIYKQTEPKRHMHLEGSSEKELIPWFIVATRLNAQNVEAWRTGTYWFYRTGDLKRAEEFIARGVRANPNDYRVYLEQGILYHRMHKWQSAVSSLEKAGALWKNDSEDAPYDLKAIRMYREDAEKHLSK